MGPIGGLSARQFNSYLPRREKKKKKREGVENDAGLQI